MRVCLWCTSCVNVSCVSPFVCARSSERPPSMRSLPQSQSCVCVCVPLLSVSQWGYTAFILAAEYGKLHVARMLATQFHADIHVRSHVSVAVFVRVLACACKRVLAVDVVACVFV